MYKIQRKYATSRFTTHQQQGEQKHKLNKNLKNTEEKTWMPHKGIIRVDSFFEQLLNACKEWLLQPLQIAHICRKMCAKI